MSVRPSQTVVHLGAAPETARAKARCCAWVKRQDVETAGMSMEKIHGR